MAEENYDVFISYSRNDYLDSNNMIIPGNVVSKVMDAFDQAGISYWLDKECVHHGDDFATKIVTNIRHADIFVFLATENSNASPWTKKEIACAHEYKKHIIPVRIDHSHYNPAVLLHIIDLDYIDYAKNPDNAIKELIDSITKILAEKLKQKEKEKERDEFLRRQKQKEKEKEISEIKLAIEKLGNEETKIEIDWKQLTLRILSIDDEETRNQLLTLIEKSGSIHVSHQKEVKMLSRQINDYKKQVKELTSQLTEIKGKTAPDPLMKKKLRKTHFSYAAILFFLLLLSIAGGLYLWQAYDDERYYHKSYERRLNEKEETVREIGKFCPFVITDIDVRNTGDSWGDPIYSNKSTYIEFRPHFICLDSGTYSLYVKFFKENVLRQNDDSPNGYSYDTEITLVPGKTKQEITGWGSKEMGYWDAGSYRVELWYNGRKIAEKAFSVL